MSYRTLVLVILSLSMPACGDDDGGANENRNDAGSNPTDSGTNPTDSGTNPTDSGTNPTDADVDAGTDGGGGPHVVEPLKAFPSAYGGGSNASGGRGGVLVIINTLDYGAPLVYDAVHDVYECPPRLNA
ncbi:MAG: hypothetical protein GY701_34410 [Sulfitobacter sp.]|nr:hypothetical protein [Sulfitobacter sp.]